MLRTIVTQRVTQHASIHFHIMTCVGVAFIHVYPNVFRAIKSSMTALQIIVTIQITRLKSSPQV